MDNELRNTAHGNTDAVANVAASNTEHSCTEIQTENLSPPATSGFVDPAKQRREKIKMMEARLQRAIARDTAASRKERNGQLFVWGAMVEGVYRDGNAQERKQLRQWAERKLTDKRHLQRAENGFARIEDEAADTADV